MNVIELVVFLMQMIDTCAEGDGERNDINIKRLLQYFKSYGTFSKYAIEMFTCIAQREVLLSTEMSHRLRWGRFVNWAGGKGRNIECDAAQEICNRTSKNIVKGMGANKTPKAIIRASKSAAGVQQIVTRFDANAHIHSQSNSHTTCSSDEDESIIINDLRKLRPFHIVPQRSHASFSDIEVSPLVGIDMLNFFAWLEKQKKNISMGLQ